MNGCFALFTLGAFLHNHLMNSTAVLLEIYRINQLYNHILAYHLYHTIRFCTRRRVNPYTIIIVSSSCLFRSSIPLRLGCSHGKFITRKSNTEINSCPVKRYICTFHQCTAHICHTRVISRHCLCKSSNRQQHRSCQKE